MQIDKNMGNSRRGTPFTFVLRDILQFDKTKEDAINRMNTTDRTCSIFVGVGDSTSDQMDIVEYSYESLTPYNSTSYPTYTAHPYIEDVIYVDKHVQPSSDPCLGNVLNEGWGNIDAKYLFQQAAARLQTGDMHVAVYDYLNQFMYVSNAQIYVSGQPQLMAYERPYVRLNMSAIFNEEL
ncbi:acid ceramidase-like protein [Reticulomyxa filosa]|uniref:Acid ceramidase-like protein n=1 Tax=Reticulomyxa filosa TaxID=46433 RepID=X6MAD2_RETFI|nr:acid ceramidase-like protein [Reticulomyxa filosa]|eukprot:ETO10631.1 acid ceramidase-like protein [Reticulomyxa filosa]